MNENTQESIKEMTLKELKRFLSDMDDKTIVNIEIAQDSRKEQADGGQYRHEI